MFLQRLSQRSAALTRMTAPMPRLLAMAQIRTYYPDNTLMPREQGEYYSDPVAVAERVVRLMACHDNVNDPASVAPAASFESLGLNALDMVEIFIGCEREFDLEISEEDCEAMSSVNDLVEFIARNPSSK